MTIKQKFINVFSLNSVKVSEPVLEYLSRDPTISITLVSALKNEADLIHNCDTSLACTFKIPKKELNSNFYLKASHKKLTPHSIQAFVYSNNLQSPC